MEKGLFGYLAHLNDNRAVKPGENNKISPPDAGDNFHASLFTLAVMGIV